MTFEEYKKKQEIVELQGGAVEATKKRCFLIDMIPTVVVTYINKWKKFFIIKNFTIGLTVGKKNQL